MATTATDKQSLINYASDAASKNSINSSWFVSLINSESSFNPNAFNPTSGAAGLGQFIPTTATWLNVNVKDPFQSLDKSAEYFKKLLDKYNGDYGLATAAYKGYSNINAISAKSASDIVKRAWIDAPKQASVTDSFLDSLGNKVSGVVGDEVKNILEKIANNISGSFKAPNAQDIVHAIGADNLFGVGLGGKPTEADPNQVSITKVLKSIKNNPVLVVFMLLAVLLIVFSTYNLVRNNAQFGSAI